MDIIKERQDAFNKVKEVVDKHNLDISDKDINEWIDDIIMTEELRKSSEEKLKAINDLLGTKFTARDSFLDIINAISNKWYNT